MSWLSRSVVARRSAGALLLVVMLAAACSKTRSAEPARRPPRVDIARIPAVIGETYVNRVLAALDEVESRATRLIVANKSFVPEAAQILSSIYSDDRFRAQAEAWVDAIEDDPQLAAVRPGSRRTTVARIITASPACVWSVVTRDYSATTPTHRPPQTEYIALRPLERSNDPLGHNPTAWMITVDGFNPDGSEPIDPCRN